MTPKAKKIKDSFFSLKETIFKKSIKRNKKPLKATNAGKEEKELLNKYCKLYRSVSDYEKKLDKLKINKEHVAKERFESLEDDYQSFLSRTKPLVADLYEDINNRLNMFEADRVTFNNELSDIQKQIRQENKLYEVDAISKEDYLEKINPLKAKEVDLQIKNKIKQIQITTLEKAIKDRCPEETSTPPPGINPDPGTPPPPFFKNPAIATVLSFLHFGLGQIYNGEIAKGIIFIILYWVSIVLCWFIIGFITTPALWIWGMIDANNSAKRINEELAAK